jgi:hypothetical protein
MTRRSLPLPHAEYDALTLASTTWLACGLVLLVLTPLPLHTATLGWSPAFWLLLAPALVLCTRRLSMRWHSLVRRAPSAHRASRPGAQRRGASRGMVASEREHRRRIRRDPTVRSGAREKPGTGLMAMGRQPPSRL